MLEYIFNLVNLFTTIKTYGTASMDSVLASSVVDCGFEPRSGQTKDNKIGICCFNANSALFQLYHGENMLIFNEMMMRSALF
jgi:hypothetical protein